MSKKKTISAATKAAMAQHQQPVPPEKIRDFYITKLELENAMAKMNEQALRANEQLRQMWAAHGVNPEAWDIDLRTGKMTRRKGTEANDAAYPGPKAAKTKANGAPSEAPSSTN